MTYIERRGLQTGIDRKRKLVVLVFPSTETLNKVTVYFDEQQAFALVKELQKRIRELKENLPVDQTP